MIFKTKNELRKYIKTVLPTTVDEKEEASLIINDKLKDILEIKECNTILSYMALKDEVIIDNNTFSINKNVFIPKVIMETNDLEFYKYTSSINLENGAYNILEPKESSEKFLFNKDYKKIVVLVPGRAFTKDGRRLGRGKGYYDKFLELLQFQYGKENITLIGIAYKEQVTDVLPCESHDIKMDMVITN